VIDIKEDILKRFGFSFTKSSVHSSRTIMLDELSVLLDSVNEDAKKEDYISSIINDNCLAKKTMKSRELTARDLLLLYSFDLSNALYRTFLYFWKRDEAARPLLTLLLAFCRDGLLRASSELILKKSEGEVMIRETMEEFIDTIEKDRFSKGSLRSTSGNLNASWAKSGHLTGRVKKVRAIANSRPASVAYALYLGYLTGVRGPELFETNFVKILDCSREKAIELAEIASQKGWIVFKRIGNVMEILFPNLITKEEAEWLREQN
jgi:hypothetical protein